MPVGGSVENVNLDGRTFAATADADVNRKLGGFENEVQANGDGTGRLIKTRVPFGLEGLVLSVDDDRGDQEYLQGLADSKGFFPINITLASGNVFQGDGQIVGDFAYSSQSTTATVNLAGVGVLTKQ